MKKLLLPLLSLVALVAIYLIFFRSGADTDNVFHISDPSLVAKIELEKVEKGQSATTLILERTTTGDWKIDGKYTAIPAKVEDFLQALTQVRVYKPIEDSGQETALALLKRNHTRIQILDRDGNELKHYLVGPTDSQHKANIMLIQGANRAYLVNRPAIEGYVSSIYSTRLNEWREKLLWNLQADQIQTVAADYGPEATGFKLSRTSLDAPWTLNDNTQPDPAATQAYMTRFKGKTFAESIATEAYPNMLDSLNRRTPNVKFTYTTFDQKSGALHLYTRPENLNNFFGIVPGTPDLFTVQHHVIDPYLMTGEYFLPKPL